jgi:hypothetical protein
MALRAEIDRGDVWYDEVPIARLIRHRPTLVLYTDDPASPSGRRALIRWPTTIGGWADQRLANGALVQRWKESDVGPRVWRDITAAPTWIPPKTTPDRDLVKATYPGWALKSELLGPGPRAAYGMVLLEHLQVVKLKDGTERFDDNGIGTHGSSTVTSIVHGTSHGCHRLYNQLAVRLADFLLKHRDHVAKGQTEEWYRRRINLPDARRRERVEPPDRQLRLRTDLRVAVPRPDARHEEPAVARELERPARQRVEALDPDIVIELPARRLVAVHAQPRARRAAEPGQRRVRGDDRQREVRRRAVREIRRE